MSKNTEYLQLISSIRSLNEEKAELLLKLNNLKVDQHLKASILSSTSTGSFVPSLSSLRQSLEAFKSSLCFATNLESSDFSNCFSKLDELSDDPIFLNTKDNLKDIESHLKSLRLKVKEKLSINKRLEQGLQSFDELKILRNNAQRVHSELEMKLMKVKNEILRVSEAIESKKKNRFNRRSARRFTLRTLPDDRLELRNKYLLKLELIKKIEGHMKAKIAHTRQLSFEIPRRIPSIQTTQAIRRPRARLNTALAAYPRFGSTPSSINPLKIS